MQVTWWIPSRRIQARLDDRFPITAPPVGAWARRIAAASPSTKATSLGTVRVDHAAWPMPSLRARRSGINHLDDGEPGVADRGRAVQAQNTQLTRRPTPDQPRSQRLWVGQLVAAEPLPEPAR